MITVKDLLLADDARRVDELMERDVISVNTLEDQEEVARVMSKYDLLSLPVVDNENRLVGVITIDDAVDVMEQEATEDFEGHGRHTSVRKDLPQDQRARDEPATA